MRIGELSSRSGVSVPMIKYYVRERMLPEGERTAVNQVGYDDGHVRRLRLIRGLIDVGGLSVSAVRDILAEIDAPEPSVHEAIAAAHRSLTVPVGEAPPEARQDAERVATTVLAERGWHASEHNPGFAALVEVIAQLRVLGQDDVIDRIGRYAEAVELIAATDVEMIAARTDVEHVVEGAVLGTVLGDVLIAALRRIGQEELFHRDADQPA